MCYITLHSGSGQHRKNERKLWRRRRSWSWTGCKSSWRMFLCDYHSFAWYLTFAASVEDNCKTNVIPFNSIQITAYEGYFLPGAFLCTDPLTNCRSLGTEGIRYCWGSVVQLYLIPFERPFCSRGFPEFKRSHCSDVVGTCKSRVHCHLVPNRVPGSRKTQPSPPHICSRKERKEKSVSLVRNSMHNYV